MRNILSSIFALLFVVLLAACEHEPEVQPVVLNYWRPISGPNVFLPQNQAYGKLNYDLAQCKCSNYPLNVPHNEIGSYAPDMGRLAETSAMQVDGPTGCGTTPDAVLISCMRARGWEPTSCSGRVASPGGTQCALSVGAQPPNYPEGYPYKGARDETYGDSSSPAERRQQYPR